MYPKEPLRVCEQCDFPHYDNCPDCFGFGVYDSERNGRIPVRAWPELGGDLVPTNHRACPTCGSTTAGIPTEAPRG